MWLWELWCPVLSGYPFEVFSDDHKGKLLLAVFPLEPAEEERSFITSHRHCCIECVIPLITEDSDTVTVKVKYVPEPQSLLLRCLQRLWLLVTFWRTHQTSTTASIVHPQRAESPKQRKSESVLERATHVTHLAAWAPDWQQVQATAADIPQQHHVFELGDGAIHVTFTWRRAYREEPARLRIEWRSDITFPGTFRLRFTHAQEPDNVFTECFLGSTLVGDETFTAADLGFDPTHGPWALMVIFEESEA